MSLSIRVREVYPLENMKLKITFMNDVVKVYDVKQLCKKFEDMFTPIINNPALFQNVYVDCGGCGVAWNDEIDISECELWENGRTDECIIPCNDKIISK